MSSHIVSMARLRVRPVRRDVRLRTPSTIQVTVATRCLESCRVSAAISGSLGA
jgi:hypothetical protein